jgi:hypothetical protein
MKAYPSDFGATVDKGMDLRDYMAGQALQGLLSDGDLDVSIDELATWAYAYAEAMLNARAK